MEKNRDTKKKNLTLNYYPKIDARHKFSSLRQQEASFVNKILKKSILITSRVSLQYNFALIIKNI